MPNSIKNFPSSSFRVTPQELDLKQNLTTEGIPFVFQKEFTFSDRSYIVDFFLVHQILLECSYTRSFKYDVALRHKAISLEAKTAFIKQYYPYPMWVLFESERPIGTQFYHTLQKFTPSIDEIFTSRIELLEYLQAYFGILNHSSSQNPFSPTFLLLDSNKEPLSDNYRAISSHGSSDQYSCPYNSSKNKHFKQSNQQYHNSPSFERNHQFNNYSQILKKRSSEKSEVFQP